MRGDGLKAAWANYKPFAHTTHTNTHFSDSTNTMFCTRATKHAWQMPAWPSPAAISCQALPIACPPTILGARLQGVALGDIHSTLLVTMYSASQSTRVQPTNTRRIEAVVASHSVETCACMPNAPRKHVLRWQQGPRLAAKREISHGLMREKHGGGGDGRSGGAACANRVHNWLE